MGALPCHPVLYCYAEEEVMAHVGMSCSGWGKHHTPPLYFRQAPNMSSLYYSKSGTPLQRLQPSLWVQETGMSSDLPSPPPLKPQGTSQPPLPLIKDQVLTKEVHGVSLLAPLQAVPHPLCNQGLPLLPMEAKWNMILECGAAQLTRQLARPHGRPARKTSFHLQSWKRNAFWISISDEILSVDVYAGWKCEVPLSALSWGGLQESCVAGSPSSPLQHLQAVR